MTTPTRVQTLYHSRLFICVCDTCTSSVSPTVDRSRGFPCPSCSPGRDDQGRYTFHHQGDHGGAELAGVVHQTGNEWVCDICWGQFEEGECVPEGGEDALEGWVEKTEEEDKREVLDPWDVAQRYNTVAGMLGPAHSATHRLLALHLKTSSHALSTQIHTADPITALSLCAHQLSTFARTRLQVPDAFDSVFATVAYYLTCAAVGLVTISDEEEEVDPEVRAVVRLCVKTAGNLCEEIKETVEERREWIVQHPGTKVYDGIMEINIKVRVRIYCIELHHSQ
ncbi:hypothetical protein DFJ77DRAFT_454251 [Powellomyces hirtus]|nr:hypothetical protein DFJ77DRAFT_454251 [Powellomyces hirtus]